MKTFLRELWRDRTIIWELAKNDCKARFAASALGVVWAFLQPLLNVFVLWFVFQVGFKSMPVADIPFIVWYIPAFLSWNFFSESVSQATDSLISYSYLLKKVNFNVTIIPLIKVISALIIHAGFIVFIVVINLIYGRIPTVNYLQMLYYCLCTFCLSSSLGWLLSAINIFLRDVANLVALVLQVGFWMTPLFWSPEGMSPVVQFLLKFNPMYYVCMGYREAVISDICFWQHPLQTLYFWTVVILIFGFGTTIFRRLRPQFVDVF